ncbi:cyclic-di-AMP phosphodiesterase GdpP [Lentibacillus halophilus]|uniref:Cyclic-di-AMP phosphodiesterase n=1 Tax=Lentibacillus halophilus TaxID=295065 RepID=A0ABP3J2X7_9BACI
MQEFQRKQPLSLHLWVMYVVAAVLVGFIWYFQWVPGLIMTLILAAAIYYSIRSERKLVDATQKYIETLSHRVKRVGEEALLEMPIGIILFNEEYIIEWANPYMNRFSDEEDTLVGMSLNDLSDDFASRIKENDDDIWMDMNGYQFQIAIRKDDRLLYFFDRTEQAHIQTRYENEQTTIAIIYLDNYEEITQNMDDTLKSQLNSKVTSVLNSWSTDYGFYLKRTSQDRFLAVLTKDTLDQLEKSKFDILDEVRELNAEQNVPVTLSIGIGAGDNTLPELGEMAQSSLDLALGRGGDQVAIKDNLGKVRFYGGRTNPMEKRTRVRARVISHALKELVRESDNVIIMGHKAPDMDAFGAAIGILNIARANDVDGYIVFDSNDVDTGVHRLVDALKQDDDLWGYFIDPDESEALVTSRSLIVVVDTHKPGMVAHEKLLNKTDYKVVIDHHRRAEEFIENPTLVYMEPYASSTAELVTELLEYQPQKLKLKMLEATALLSGIIVDTKSFTLRTGSRTFDAASYLRSKGADTVLVQRFMKEDLDLYIKRGKLIERAEIYSNSIAIAKGSPGEIYGGVLLAQTADTLLTMSGINASFVISERDDGRIGISARSLGDVNVQVIMEKMNGGGHLTNAATQIEDTTIDDAEALLKDILEEYFTGGETE